MPGLDFLISDDGDYVDDGKGGFAFTTTAQPAIRHQLNDDFGAWVGDTTAGREKRGINGRNASEREILLERDSYLKALAVLEAAGLIDNIEVDVVRELPTRLAIRTRCRDTQSGGALESGTLTDTGA